MGDEAGFRVHLRRDAVAFAAGDVALLLQFEHAGVELVGIPLANHNQVVHAAIIDLYLFGCVCGAIYNRSLAALGNTPVIYAAERACNCGAGGRRKLTNRLTANKVTAVNSVTAETGRQCQAQAA